MINCTLLSRRYRLPLNLAIVIHVVVGPHRMVRLGARNWFVSSRTHGCFQNIGLTIAIRCGVNSLLEQSVQRLESQRVDRERTASRRKDGRHIVGHHSAGDGLWQPTQLHGWSELAARGPSLTAIARERETREKLAIAAAVGHWIVVVSQPKMCATAGGVGVSAQSGDEMVHVAADRVQRYTRNRAPVGPIGRRAEDHVVGRAAALVAAILPRHIDRATAVHGRRWQTKIAQPARRTVARGTGDLDRPRPALASVGGHERRNAAVEVFERNDYVAVR